LIVTGGINEWINRVNHKQAAFAKLHLSEDMREALINWTNAEFARSSLRLDAAVFSEADLPDIAETSPAGSGLSGAGSPVVETIAALDVARQAGLEGSSAKLTPQLLQRLHSPPPGDPGVFRKGPAAPARFGNPPPPRSLFSIVEALCQWTQADSFLQLHPVEQSAIVHLRLIEIQPFESANNRTARVGASFFLMRAGLPPLIVEPGLERAYEVALDEAIRLNTRPMVELVAEATEGTLANLTRQATAK
jgi:hypothetical protein